MSSMLCTKQLNMDNVHSTCIRILKRFISLFQLKISSIVVLEHIYLLECESCIQLDLLSPFTRHELEEVERSRGLGYFSGGKNTQL
uniref:Uncharacterized protein n=1 Tax=Cucumis melo TaxID=3656 RepID=A0A9I9EEA8_CUCME